MAGAPDLRGLSTVFWAGYVTLLAGWFVAPGAAVAALHWLLAPHFGWQGDDLTAGAWASGCWIIANLLVFGGFRIAAAWRDARSLRRHREFMALRDRFYARDAVCVESLESLRARAAQADR